MVSASADDLTFGNPDESDPDPFVFQTIGEFAAEVEPDAVPLIGTADQALIAADSDAMLYGDGGAGKTTLAVELTFCAAAGTPFLGIEVPRPLRSMLIEAEGSRGLFRRKLDLKLGTWDGPPADFNDRIKVLAEPWAALDLTDPKHARKLADKIIEYGTDLVIVGPLTAVGMDTPGTIAEARQFVRESLGVIRGFVGRPVAFLIVHHEAKGGKVSGAWEGVGDTLLHMSKHARDTAVLHVKKARNASDLHDTKLSLRWGDDGNSFVIDTSKPDEQSRAERAWDGIAQYVLKNPGCGWGEVKKAVSGEDSYLKKRRESMLDAGVLVDALGRRGQGKQMKLYHRDDPKCPPPTVQIDLDPTWAADRTSAAQAPILPGAQDSEGAWAVGRLPSKRPTAAQVPSLAPDLGAAPAQADDSASRDDVVDTSPDDTPATTRDPDDW